MEEANILASVKEKHKKIEPGYQCERLHQKREKRLKID